MCNLKKKIENGFEVVGYKIACHAWKVCIISLLCNAFLGLGLIYFRSINNEEIYLSDKTQTRRNMDMLVKVFGEQNQTEFYPFQSIRPQMYAELIIWRSDHGNLINSSLTGQINLILNYVKDIKVNSGSVKGNRIAYSDVCSRRNASCVIDGEDILEEVKLNEKIKLDKTGYGKGGYRIKNVANYTLKQNYIATATFLRFRFYLKPTTDAKIWINNFIKEMQIFPKKKLHGELLFVFAHSGSFFEELSKDSENDVNYFSLVFTLYVVYFGFIFSGGNNLTNRSNIGRFGILITPISIAGAWGALAFSGVMYTDIAGIVPFFILGHQSINLTTTLSRVSDVVHLEDGKRRVSYAVKKSIVPVTTTLLCHTLPFVVGVLSSFSVVHLVSIYTVTTLVFNYLNHFILFTACVALHERRVDIGRHYCTCAKLLTADELKDKNCCLRRCCTGSKATKRSDTESKIQRFFRNCMSYLLPTPLVKFTAILSCIIIFAFALNALLYNVKGDVIQADEVRAGSYFYEWNKIVNEYFEKELEVQVAVAHPRGFTDARLIVLTLMETLKSQTSFSVHSALLWYDLVPDDNKNSFFLEKNISTYVSNSLIPIYPFVSNDLKFNAMGNKIIASRFYFRFKTISTSSTEKSKQFLTDILDRFNNILEIKYNGLCHSVFPDERCIIMNSPDFILIDDFMRPLWDMFTFFAVQMCVLFFMSLMFSQGICNMLFAPFCYAYMIVCILGLSTFYSKYICQVTMLFLVISACYCIEVLVHIGHSNHKNANETMKGYYKKLSIAIQNIGLILFGQLIAILALLNASSFFFGTLFLITITTTGICIITSLLWLPTLMTFPWLPNNTRIKDDPKPVNKHDALNDNHALNPSEQLESIEVSKTESRKSIHSTSLTENESCIKLESRQSYSNETPSQSLMIKDSKEIAVNTTDLGCSTINKIEQGYDEILKGTNPNIIDVFISTENTACQNVSTNQPDGGAEGTISLEKSYDLDIKDIPNSQEDKEHISKTVCDVQNEATEANGKLESNNPNNIDGLISTENTDCQNISTNLPDCEAKGSISMEKCYDLEIKDTPNSHEDRGHISETVCDVLNEATQENDKLESNNLNNINVFISTENTDCPNV
ncbi:uncharacterized protein LOC132756158 [Ruditapes philippinarum]|uniref:uncharacterized protein LOC132756158 n=1 Tax=Ruditapes philippinarum TaxID=129788 RepID=UPI00295A8618|nr:uncharacterized protein LOC132756158 [Ruditapes philippinarum]